MKVLIANRVRVSKSVFMNDASDWSDGSDFPDAPPVELREVAVDDESAGLGMFATQNIKTGEHILYLYPPWKLFVKFLFI